MIYVNGPIICSDKWIAATLPVFWSFRLLSRQPVPAAEWSCPLKPDIFRIEHFGSGTLVEIDILKPCAGEDCYSARTIMAVEP